MTEEKLRIHEQPAGQVEFSDGSSHINLNPEGRKMGKRDFLRLVRDVGLIATGAAANKGINHIVGNQEHSDVETAQSVTYSPASTELLAQYREVDQENITQAKKMIQEINTNEHRPCFIWLLLKNSSDLTLMSRLLS